MERPTKIIKLNSTASASERGERESSSLSRVTVIEIKDEPSSSNSTIVLHERESDRHGSSTRSLKDNPTSNSSSSKKDDRIRERDREREQRDREREHRNQLLEEMESSTSRLKREKRREDRYRNESPSVEPLESVSSKIDYDRSERETRDREYDRSERERRDRDRDLSSVSNESIGSLQQQRRSQDVLEYEKGKCFLAMTNFRPFQYFSIITRF